MNKKDLIHKYVHWALIHLDMNKNVPIKEVLKEAEIQVTLLTVMMHKGCIAAAARALGESRTTVSERIRIKGQVPNEELQEIADAHSVDYFVREKKPQPQLDYFKRPKK